MKALPVILWIACLALLAAQTAPEVEIGNEPHHHLMFENHSVRVFNVQVDPGTETLVHWHRHDYIAVTLAAAEISNRVKDQPAVAVSFLPGDARFSPAPFAHSVRTTGAQAFRNVTVELLEDETLRQSAAKSEAQHKYKDGAPKKSEDKDKDKDERGLEILPNGTRQILFVKDGIRASEFELQPGAAIPMHLHKTPHLLIAVSDLDLRENIKGDGPALAHYSAGEAKWFPAAYAHALKNSSTAPAKFVTLEFP